MKSLFYLFSLGAMTTAPALAQDTPRDLRDMVGARAGQAESELVRRGYRNVRGEKGDDRSYTYWWNDDREECVTIATMDGRYSSITATTPPDCRQSGARSSRDRRGYSDRDGADRDGADRDGRPERPSYGSLDTTRLQRECRMEASESFDRRPGELFVNAPIRQPNGYIVQGWYEQPGDKRNRFFNCRFDRDSAFINLN